MTIAPTDFHDLVGMGKGDYGELAAQKSRNQSLKQYAPQAMAFTNIDPNTAPGPKKIPAVKGAAPIATAPVTPAPQKPGSKVSQTQPKKPAITGNPVEAQPGRGFGPSSGLGQAPGSAPVAANAPRRGFGEHSGLVPPELEGQANQPMPPSPHAMMTRTMSEAFRHLAALPHASPIIQQYARISAQRDQQAQ